MTLRPKSSCPTKKTLNMSLRAKRSALWGELLQSCVDVKKPERESELAEAMAAAAE